MAGIKWSAFDAGVALTTSNEFVGLQSGVNVRWTISQLATFLSTATLGAGTITTSQPLTLTQTWNAGGVTFTALKVNITATASAAASLLMDLQVGSSSMLTVSKAGLLTIASQLYFGDSNNRIGTSGGKLFLTTNGNDALVLNGGAATGASLPSTNYLAWASTSDPNTTIDVALYRDAAGTLAQRNGVNAQAFNIYNTYANSGTDYERLRLAWVTNALQLFTGQGGTGSGRSLSIGTDGDANVFISTNGTQRLNISSAGIILASATATPANGSAAASVRLGTTSGFGIYYGSGAPTGLSAAQGSLYIRSDGTGVNDRAYINSSSGSGTTWTAIVTVG